MIELKDIRKVFNSGKPNEFAAVQGISLSIEARRATVLKGLSGSGKTTLLSLIGCMARPTAGRIMLFDREITSLPERFLTEIRRRSFGLRHAVELSSAPRRSSCLRSWGFSLVSRQRQSFT